MPMPMPMPVPDPATMIAAVSAVFQAVQTWVTFRDKKRAASDFDESYRESAKSEATAQEAGRLQSLIPGEILGTMVGRVDNCWKKFRGVIEPGEKYLPDEVDEAVEQVKACVCRELTRIYKLNKSIPPGKLSEYWEEYCN